MTDEITTPEALDALPVGSVVLDGMGDAWQHSDAHTYWWAPANPFYDEADAANVLEQGGTEHPATLLHRPDRPSDLAAEVERLRHWTFDDPDTPSDAEFVALADLRALLTGREADR